MKLLNVAITLIFAIMTVSAHAQVTEDSGLPSGGENTAPPTVGEPPPVSNPGEFNQDIDDFEKKLSKEVPPANGKHGTPPPGADATAPKKSGDSTAKARDAMKKAHDSAESEGGNGIAARKAAKKSGAGASAGKKGKTDKKSKKSDKKKSGKKSGSKKSDGKKSSKKKKSAE